MSEHFYARERGAHGEERFFATEHTRGPWSNDHQHGGPPSALLARAIEATPTGRDGEPGPPMLVARLSVELLRPIPIAAPLEVEIDVLAAGRKVQRVAAALISGDRQLAVAVATRIRLEEIAIECEPHELALLAPVETCPPFQFDFFLHAVGYHTAIEARVAHGEFGSGRMAVWMRPRMPLVAGEVSTPLQRITICADAGHGVGTALDTTRWSFVNPDVNIHLHRLPVDDWLGMDAVTFSGPMGVGLCRTRLLDRRGELGQVLQSQVIDHRR